MADYNFHRPDIVGQEWVPILDAAYQPDTTTEHGYAFTATQTGAPLVLNRGVFYVQAVPPGVTTSQVPFMSVYPKGTEVPVGAAMRTTIPCSAATNTGPNGGYFGDLSGFTALQNPSDGSGFSFGQGTSSTTANGTLELAFDVSASQISGFSSARIFNVSFIYAANGNGVRSATYPNFILTSVRYKSTDVYYGTGLLEGGVSTRGDLTTALGRISLGEINPNWSLATYTGTADRYPWTESKLQLFDESSADPMRFRFNWQIDTTVPQADEPSLMYAALEVTWAPFDNRTAYGGRHMGLDQTISGTEPYYSTGDNFVILRTSGTLVTGGALKINSGEYVVTSHLADLGDMNQPLFGINAAAATNTRPTFNAIRELYQEPPIQGVEIDRVLTLNDTMVIRESRIIPAIGVSVTGAAAANRVYSGCHGYASQTQGTVFVLGTTSQVFQSVNLDGTLPYPQVRFYARLASGAAAGRLRFADNVSANNTYVEISGTDLMALPEIVDGWREVTLRFTSPSNVPTMDGSTTSRTWVWTLQGLATDEYETSYEILAAASATQLQDANYETSSNDASIGFGRAPFADTTFLFSTDPPAVTGLGVVPSSFAVTGIGTECSTTPACIPSTVPYHRVTWSLPNFGTNVQDTFDRNLTSSWGSANTGQSWTNVSGSASDYSVTGSAGVHTHTAVNVGHHSVIGPTTVRDFEAYAELQWPGVSPTGAAFELAIIGRYTNTSNYYYFRTRWTETDLLEVAIVKVVAGVFTQLGSSVFNPQHFPNGGTANGIVSMRAQAQGSMLRVKVWEESTGGEPVAWTVVTSDTALTAGQVGLRSELISGNTNTLPVSFRFPTFLVTPVASNFGYYELQRSDVDTDWQTILKATSPGVTGFNDLEARIGLQSDYRIRQVNIHEFAGPWSSTVSGTLTASTVNGSVTATEILTFTTNTDQGGARALAYAEVWDNNPRLDLSFFEGDNSVQFQRMYGRDFQVGFHGLERGGVRFERALLVQNAAVSAPVLNKAFRSLRDLAWEGVPYICVRTDTGDRWFATVEVPSGNLRRRRKLQLVQIRVTETGDISTVVDVDPLFTANP
jgi:hypothetical protein